jgi:hypothetical protein
MSTLASVGKFPHLQCYCRTTDGQTPCTRRASVSTIVCLQTLVRGTAVLQLRPPWRRPLVGIIPTVSGVPLFVLYKFHVLRTS